MFKPRPLHLLAAFAAATGFAVSANAALVNSYSASNPSNGPLDGNGDGVIDDELDTVDLGANGLSISTITSGFKAFSNAWEPLTTTSGIGGVGGAEVNPFNGFGGEGTVELYIKTDLTSESATGDDELVFESGAQGIGFSLGIVPNTAGDDPLLRFFNNHTDFTISLAGLDDTDFIQIAAIIDETAGASSFVTLVARDASGTATSGTNVFTGNGDIAGGDGLGVFNTDGSGSGLTDSGGTNNNASIAFDDPFSGQVAAFNFYDAAESEATLLGSYNAVIPEPASLALLGLGGLLIAGRQKR